MSEKQRLIEKLSSLNKEIQETINVLNNMNIEVEVLETHTTTFAGNKRLYVNFKAKEVLL